MLAYDFLYQRRAKNLNQKIYDLESLLNAKPK